MVEEPRSTLHRLKLRQVHRSRDRAGPIK